jgi:hypothetical protein
MERSWLDDSAQRVATLVTDASVLALQNWNDGLLYQKNKEKYAEAIEIYDAFESAMLNDTNLGQYNDSLFGLSEQNTNDLFFPTFAVAEKEDREACRTFFSFRLTRDIREWLQNLFSYGTINLEKKNFTKNVNNFHQTWSNVMRSLSACLNEYPEYLSATDDWKKEQMDVNELK